MLSDNIRTARRSRGYTEVDLDALADIPDFRDARQAQDTLYDRIEALGGTVEVVSQEGLALPERASK